MSLERALFLLILSYAVRQPDPGDMTVNFIEIGLLHVFLGSELANLHHGRCRLSYEWAIAKTSQLGGYGEDVLLSIFCYLAPGTKVPESRPMQFKKAKIPWLHIIARWEFFPSANLYILFDLGSTALQSTLDRQLTIIANMLEFASLHLF